MIEVVMVERMCGGNEMAKQSVIEARKAQALESQAESIAQLQEQLARLEAKIDQLLENKPEPAKPQAKRGAA